jgi:hypothetical protein
MNDKLQLIQIILNLPENQQDTESMIPNSLYDKCMEQSKQYDMGIIAGTPLNEVVAGFKMKAEK